MTITDGYGFEVPFVIPCFVTSSIAGDLDFTTGSCADRPVVFRVNATGDVKVLTWGTYVNNKFVVNDADAETLFAVQEGVWEMTYVVKIYESGTTATHVNHTRCSYTTTTTSTTSTTSTTTSA